MNEDMIDRLADKIWITRKSRINSAERLILTNTLSQIFINYYTLVILSISIWTLFSNDENNNNLSFITVVASLFIFAGTVGVNSLNFKERISKFKSCYIKLDELNGDLEILKNDLSKLGSGEPRQRFEIIRSSYIKMLEDIENHHAYDYLKFQVNNKYKINYGNYLKYYFYNFVFILVILILVLIPFSPIILLMEWK
jgi:hypothetical protein